MQLHFKKCSVYALNEVLVDSFSYQLTSGKTYFIFGQIGLGKSLLLDQVAQASLSESPHLEFSEKPRLSFLFQKNALIPWLTVKENLKLLDLSFDFESDDLFCALSLKKLLLRKAADLSGGEAQKVNFYRALAYRPNIILADEPFASLDIKQKNQMTKLLSDYVKKHNCLLLWVSHDLIEICTSADEVLCFSKSKKSFSHALEKPEINLQALSDFIQGGAA